ncbi:hypothetical protein H310_07556 [Aphanomyces invadans]|uniref:Rhodanese domain-containing protein n=1 Tax=Aphanomyces invadans TaxID=157072 RepID=A0A024U1L7_9STRA|nr:hypothetical protein H310_07556 [Aphanomyces invadans]ETW00149.1 hypothetical protein H310_07556 [Aphanomyces invadans]|eukprot:XP_008871174.1 hypothetical protein H310_07556 [Aphanomyces invadans]
MLPRKLLALPRRLAHPWRHRDQIHKAVSIQALPRSNCAGACRGFSTAASPNAQPLGSRPGTDHSTITFAHEDQQYLSFYKYATVNPVDLPHLRKSMLQEWRAMGVLGRVYIAEVGINAQITVPVSQHAIFRSYLQSHPHPLFHGVFFNSGGELNDENNDRQPFHTLHVRVRSHLANDGLNIPLDMSNRGQELSPREWHDALDDPRPKRVFDCRNYYEHDVGRFDHAERIMVETFKETFATLDEMLQDTPTDTTCMIYCTGGIRCEKVGAYLTQKGYTDVKRLEGGIVHYAQFIKQHTDIQSKFKGRNFVFDQRLSNINTAITDDVLAHCYTCGQPCNTHTNCSNTMCHGLILQCANCAISFDGACSLRCQNMKHVMDQQSREQRRTFAQQYAYQFQHHLVPNGRIRPGPPARTPSGGHRSFSSYSVQPSEELYQYVVATTSSLDKHTLHQLRALRSAIDRDWSQDLTAKMIPEALAAYLHFLLKSSGAASVLEIGSFVGYSALAMALALPDPRHLVTCDIDPKAHAWASQYFKTANIPIDLRLQDGFEVVESLAAAHRQFDFIFVDGNKAGYTALYEAILDRQLLTPHGFVVFDNTLFRGQVVNHAMGQGHPKEKVAAKLAAFNQRVASDTRTHSFVLPLWDGLTMVRPVLPKPDTP